MCPNAAVPERSHIDRAEEVAQHVPDNEASCEVETLCACDAPDAKQGRPYAHEPLHSAKCTTIWETPRLGRPTSSRREVPAEMAAQPALGHHAEDGGGIERRRAGLVRLVDLS